MSELITSGYIFVYSAYVLRFSSHVYRFVPGQLSVAENILWIISKVGLIT